MHGTYGATGATGATGDDRVERVRRAARAAIERRVTMENISSFLQLSTYLCRYLRRFNMPRINFKVVEEVERNWGNLSQPES